MERSDFFKSQKNQIIREIENLPKEYILNVDATEYCEYLKDKYILEPLVIHREMGKVSSAEPFTKKVDAPYGNPTFALYGNPRCRIFKGYHIKVEYPFEGTPELFECRPTSFSIGGRTAELRIDKSNKRLIMLFEVFEDEKDSFNEDKKRAYDNQIPHFLTINTEVENFNNSLDAFIKREFMERRSKVESENAFFRAINLQPQGQIETSYVVPTIQKKSVPKPSVKEKEFKPQPTMGDKTYEDILSTLYNVGKGAERKPSMYSGRQEEDLRDMFLQNLESRYESTTATGETFNSGGKTDICLKYAPTGENLFIAECKFWHGQKAYSDAINQLFDRYLTIRDSKVALMIFVSGSDFSSAVQTIREMTKKHPYFHQELTSRAETSLSYLFHLPTDNDRLVQLSVLVFHFPKDK